MPKQLEKKLIEDYLIEELRKKGWVFVKNEDLEREAISEPLLVLNFKKALERLNEDLGIGEEEINKVVQEIRLLPTSQEGAKKLLHYFKYGIGIKFEKDRVIKTVKIFDFENLENNEFLVSKQVSFKGREIIRPDILLFVNGVPLIEIECKNPAEIGVSWKDAYFQVKDYEKIVPELYKYLQIGIAVETEARYFPIVPWQKEVLIYEWKEEGKDSIEAILEFLRTEKILDILRNFLFIREERGEMTKVITRYMQYRAANKIVERVLKNLEGKEEKNKGLIWHWQGSGKTLTMIFACHKLYFDKRLENPTIFFIVDRIDLETQLFDEFNYLKLNLSLEKIEDVSSLREVIKADNFRGKRGVFITLLHKFKPGEDKIKNLNLELQKLSGESISNRKNVICFLDEVHRSQYGLMAAQMKKILKNAFFFGFTGTPIAEEERNTYETFGYPLKEEGYLDKYFVEDSIKDNFTVPILYQPRLEKEVHLKKEDLKAFLESPFEELEEVEREKIEKAVSQKLNKIKVFLENPKRIKEITKDIAAHFKENLDGKFKAMVVTGSRKACVLYKRALDEALPSEYTEVVMTYQMEDKEPIKEYREEVMKRYPEGAGDMGKINIEIRDKFKIKDLPKILIVTDMLLTGFDAPILQTIYLDKLLKKHRLLQAIARTNRPYKEIKEAGLIIDYVGILRELKQAYKMYYKKAEIENVLFDYKILAEKFIALLKELDEIFKGISQTFERDKFFEAFERLKDIDNEKKFVEKYHNLRKVFEMLGAEEIKVDFLEKFKWYSALYVYYLKIKKREEDKEKIEKYFSKVLDLIHQSTEIEKINKELPVFTFDESYFEKIQKASLTEKEKAVNILFALEKLVLVEQKRNPIYKTIAEKVEELVRKWKMREIDYQILYGEVFDIQKEISKKEREKEILGLSPLEYGIFLDLRKVIKDKEETMNVTKELKEKISEYMLGGWINQPVLRQGVFREVRILTRKLKVKYGLSLEEFERIYRDLTNIIENYGG
jgi:type I restriction enzyme R subunit